MTNPLYMAEPSSDPQSDYESAIGYMQPFYNTGINAMGNYYDSVNKLMKHPAGLENKIMLSYHMSPYAQYQTNTLSKQMGNQAALSGNLGTPDEQTDLASQEQGIVSKDENQYIQNAMKPYEWGLQGDQYLTGLGAKSGMAMGSQKDLEAMLAEKQSAGEMGLLGAGIGGAAKIGAALI